MLYRNQLPFEWYPYIGRASTPSPDIVVPSDLPLLKAASFDKFCLVAPQPQEIDRLNKSSTRAFQRAINQGSSLPLTSSIWVKSTYICRLSDNFDNERRKVCCKVSQRQCCRQSIAFRVVSIYWQGGNHFPLKSWLQVTYPLLKAASFDTTHRP